jgi:glycosyltransferase involved in cell wall biosynthesis
MLSLSDSVLLTGLVNNMEDVYEKASILTCTSRWEGFGIFIIEAFSYGIPCISFDCPCGPATIIQDNTGFLIPEGDLNSFCEKLIEMMNNDDLRHFMGRNAFERSKKVFAEDVIMEKWKKLFEDLTTT